MKFQDRLQRDMTAEIEQDETSASIAKELLELGLIHEVCSSLFEHVDHRQSCPSFQSDYDRVQKAIDKAFKNTWLSAPENLSNNAGTSLLDVKKTAVVAATAALITAQALHTQLSHPVAAAGTNGILMDNNVASTWTNANSQPVMFLPT